MLKFLKLERIPLRKYNRVKGISLTGFTLIELMIVVIILGILAGTIGLSHTRARERAMDKYAQRILQIIRAAERNYKMETGNYYPMPPGGMGEEICVTVINSALNLDIVYDGDWEYKIFLEYPTGSNFWAWMYRNKGGFNRSWTITANTVNATCYGNCP